MVKIGREKTRPNTLVSAASVRGRTLADKVYCVRACMPVCVSVGPLHNRLAGNIFYGNLLKLHSIIH